VINIEKFAGLVTNASPYAIPPGAAVTQVNVQCISPGQLNVRPGLQAYTLSSTVSATQPVVSAFSFQHAGGSIVVYQDAFGRVFSSRATAVDGGSSLTGVPSAPRALTATAGSASVSLDWLEPEFAGGGGGVTGYTIQSSIDGGTTWAFSMSTTDSLATVTGLTNGRAYVFRVAATNNYGISAYSTASASVTPVGVPDSPTNLIVSAANSGAALTWTAPTNNGGSAITDYVVQYSVNAGQAWTAFADGTSTLTSANVSGLTNGQPYVFRVAARNAIGTSEYVAYMTATYPVGVPDQVGSLVATYGNAQISLTWQAPAANDVGGLTDYLIQRSIDSGVTWTTLTDGANLDTTYLVTQLTNGTPYAFRVAAANAIGAGPYSNSTGNVIPRTLAGAPTALTATPGNGEIALSWTAPASNGGAAITDYQIQVSASGGAYSTISKAASTTTSYTATGLTNGTAYVYRVSAVNSEGAGAHVQSSSTTPQTVPLAPTNVLTTPNNAYVTVRWTAPSDSGGSVITDYIVQFSSDGGSSWTTFADGTSTTLQTNVTGLTNGQAYVFRVAAVSAVGTGNYSTNSASTTPVGPPGIPTSPLVSGGNTQMFANWTAPATDGGSAITGYVIQYRRTDLSYYDTYGTVGNVLEYTISGLTNGRGYFFRVAAVNAVGTGSYSADSASVTVGQVPAAVATPTITNAYANSLNDTTLTLSWTAPNSAGSRITDYLIQYSTSSSGPWTLYADGTGNATTATITGQNANTLFYYRVSAVSTVGAGPYSTAPASKRIATTPAAPTLTAVASAGYVTITWPASSDGGAAITSAAIYRKYEASANNFVGNTLNDAIYNADINLTTRTAIVPACAGATRYAYSIALTNLAGASSYGTSNGVTTIDGPSSAHTVSTEFVDGNCVLSVTRPGIGGCGLSQLLSDYSTDSGSTWTAITSRSTSLTAYPTSPIGVYWDEYRGLGRPVRQWILPPTTNPFLVRTRLGDASGNALSGSNYVTTSALTTPEPSDALWSSVMYLWDGNVRKSWTLEANGTRSVVDLSASPTAGTGRFGTLCATATSPQSTWVGYAAAVDADNSTLYDTGGVTYEWWMKCPGAGTTIVDPVLSLPLGTSDTNKLLVFFTSGSAVIRAIYSGSVYTLTTISTLQDQMVHCAVENGASGAPFLFVYINGTYKPNTNGLTAGGSLGNVRTSPTVQTPIESVRITRGLRYRGRFLPPNAQFWHPT
jgi:hypothetical protein